MLRSAFIVKSLSHTRSHLRVVWGDGVQSTYPNVFLRASARDPTLFDPASFMNEPQHLDFVSANAAITSVSHQPEEAESVKVEWEDHRSSFDASWLRAQDVRGTSHLAKPIAEPSPWDSSLPGGVREYDFSKRHEDFGSWMKDMRRWGIILVHGCPRNEEGTRGVMEMFGPLKQRYHPANIFKLFRSPGPESDSYVAKAEVVDRAAYGTDYLGGHTDNTEATIPAKLESFHCIDYHTREKDTFSFVADTLKVFEHLRQSDPETFHLLSTMPLAHSRRRLTVEEECDPKDLRMYEYDLVVKEPVIILDKDGNVKRFRFRYNKHIPTPLGTYDAEQYLALYHAVQKLQTALNDRRFHQSFILKPGMLMLFDNHRVVHGRYEIAPGTKRYMLGTYLNEDSWLSRWRLLLGEWAGLEEKWLYGCSEESLTILTRRYEEK